MSTAVHHAEHGLDLPTRIARARMGVLLLILSDAGFVGGMYASHAYLRILSSVGVFHPKDESPPSIGLGIILALVMVVAALVYFWGWRQLAKGSLSQYRTGLFIAWVLTLIALVAQIVVLFSIHYATPIHGYGSLVTIMSAYHLIHLFIAALIGFLLVGRVRHGRIAGHEYAAEVSGYWWYYVAATAITSWAIMSFVT
jgi:hypothetical protein